MASRGSHSPEEDRDSALSGSIDGDTGSTSDPFEVLRRSAAEADARKDRLRSRRFLPAEAELFLELEETAQDATPRKPLSRQVGVRLQPAQWKRLLLVAEWSGVRPTTMARMLINRGARAIIDEELRHRRELGADSD